MQPPIPPRSRDRLAGLRLPELPPRDLERLAAGPHSAPAPSTAPDSAGYLPPPSASPTKFGGEGSPADVRGYAPAGTPLLMRGGVVSPGVGGGSGLVLPSLSLPLSNSLPPASMLPTVPLSFPNPNSTTPPVPSSTIGITSTMQPPHGSTNPLTLPSHNALTIRRVSGRSSPPPPMRLISGARTTPSSPVTCGMSQNEIKKAQNRKSAKRFREAQKQRWKNMADDLMAHKRTIDELRAQLASQSNTVAQATTLRGNHALGSGPDGKRSSMSINELVDTDSLAAAGDSASNIISPPPAYADAEAALYAQILSNKANSKSLEGHGDPYAKELGILVNCLVVENTTARIVSARRGPPSVVGAYGTDGLGVDEANEYCNALLCGKPVAIVFHRDGSQVNAVMNPVEGSDRVVVAEFSPL